jgi:hypothetical protein
LGALFELDVSSHGGVPICVYDGNGGLTSDKSENRTVLGLHISGNRVNQELELE